MELFVDLGLKEIASIISRMGLTTDVDICGDVELNGIKYNYEKIGNTFIISDSQGRETRISINYQEQMGKDAYNRDVRYIKHDVSIDYLLDNGEFINLSNDISLDPGFESFENIHRHDIIKGLRCKYCDKDGKTIASFGLDIDRICLKDDRNIYEFNKDGITCGNKTISLDGNELLSISGEEIPNIDTVLSFDLEKEQDKIRNIINSNESLHPFTVEALEDTIRLLDRKNRYVKNIVTYYNTDIKEVRKAIKIRKNISDSLENKLIDKDALELVSNEFFNITRNKTKRKQY